MNRIEETISGLIMDRFSINLDDLMNDPLSCHLDSLDRVELCMDIENCYDIEIMVAEMESWETFDDVVKYIEKKIGVEE